MIQMSSRKKVKKAKIETKKIHIKLDQLVSENDKYVRDLAEFLQEKSVALTTERDGNNLRFYIDGVEITGSPLDITGWGSLDMALPFYINTLSSDTGGFVTDWSTNIMDEVRVSNIARSANWIATEYSNQFHSS